MFPHSGQLLAMKAVSFYNARQPVEAEHVFEQLRAKDPFRLDNLDVLSNVLYVTVCISLSLVLGLAVSLFLFLLVSAYLYSFLGVSLYVSAVVMLRGRTRASSLLILRNKCPRLIHSDPKAAAS